MVKTMVRDNEAQGDGAANRQDPLSELARMIGEDNLYADLLMQRKRSEAAHDAADSALLPSHLPEAAALVPDDETDIPAMQLRGDSAALSEPGPSLDWDELERDLARFSVAAKDAAGEAAVHAAEPQAPVEPEQPHEEWALRGAAEPEMPALSEPALTYDEEVRAEAEESESVSGDAVYQHFNDSLEEVRALHAPEPTPVPPDSINAEEELARFLGHDRREAVTDEDYDFEQRAADILDDERAQTAPSPVVPAAIAGAGALAAGAALAKWRERGPRAEAPTAPEPKMRAAIAESEPEFTTDGHMPPHTHVFPEDEPRRKGGLATIGMVVALALAGAGGVYAYKSIGRTTGEPKLVKADPAPMKVPAQQESNAVAAKAIVDRMEPGKDKVVAREEQPLSQSQQAAQLQPPAQPAGPRVIPLSPQNDSGASAPIPPPPAATTQPPAAPAGDSVVRTVKTVPITGPGGTEATTPAGSPPVVSESTEPSVAPTAAGLPLPRPNESAEPRKVKTVQVSPDGRIASPAISVTPKPAAPAAKPANTPLSIMPADQPARPAQVAAAQPRAAAPATGGGFVVQITSQRTDAEARSAYTRLQSKHSVLADFSANIRAVDLGEKGTYHRVRVGPMAREKADGVCRQIKAGGGDCIVQPN